MTAAVALPRPATVASAAAGIPPRPTLAGIWRSFWRQPWSFRFTCLYVFFEYVRPQQVYPALQVLPWAKLTIIAACLAFVADGCRFRTRPAILGVLLGMSAVVLLSSLFAFAPSESFEKIDAWVNWTIAIVLIIGSVRNVRQLYIFLALYLLWSLKMSQYGARALILTGGGASGAPGWFQNTGEFALQMTMFVPLSFCLIQALRPRLGRLQYLILMLLPASGVLSIVGSGSRGGQLALACILLAMLMRSQHRVRGAIATIVLSAVVWQILPQDQIERFKTAGSDKTSVSRLAYWKAGMEMARTHPVLGIGYENWGVYYLTFYPPSKGGIATYGPDGKLMVEVSHNSFIEVVSQLGFTGLFLFCFALFTVLRTNSLTRSRLRQRPGPDNEVLRAIALGLDYGMIGFVVAGFFMAVAFYPFVWIHLAMSGALHAVVLKMGGTGKLPNISRSGTAGHVQTISRRFVNRPTEA